MGEKSFPNFPNSQKLELHTMLGVYGLMSMVMEQRFGNSLGNRWENYEIDFPSQYFGNVLGTCSELPSQNKVINGYY